MYSINDLKKETLISLDGVPFKVVDSQHVSLGRGGAVMRTKLKNLLNGSVQERTFRPAEKVEPAQIDRLQMQFLYRDGQQYHFMNEATYEQEAIGQDVLGEAARFIAEGSTVTLINFGGKVIGLELPNSLFLKITQTEPGIRGDTATAAMKTATVETGVQLQVPLFINPGDVVKVDTRTGQYLERKK
ncbi:MAG TPA: elongation factor P [Candidatus Saccharimonadales bacterium]|nr:elongation factor P [Candidatus Saccharimonadales bacterium]